MKLDSTNRNSVLEELEKEIARYVGTRHAVICSSGRTAIRLSLLAFGVGHGDVVVPDFACQILPITVFCAGAVPRFCDIDKQTLAMSPKHLPESIGPNTKAVIFIHLFGFPVDPSPILEITNRRGIPFIDDAAQALGAGIRGKKVGSFGDVGILTFNKPLNIDLGGAVTTNDEDLATKIKSIREKYESKSLFASLGYGMMKFSRLKSRKIMKLIFLGDKHLHKWRYVTFAKKHFQLINGWANASQHVLELWRSGALTTSITDQLLTYGAAYWHKRKLELLEILFLEQELRNSEKYLQNRRKVAKMYDELLGEQCFNKIIVPPDSDASYFRYPIVFSDESKYRKSLKGLSQAGFYIDGRYKPLHRSPFFNGMNKNLSFKESVYVSKHILPLPVKPDMTSEEVEKVVSIVNLNSPKW